MSDSIPNPAYEINGQPAPRADFYALACNPQRSVLIEACAGAGKTWMLVSRMVLALLNGAAPHEILAITFTKKASGEMRERLLLWLKSYADADDATLRRELLLRGLQREPTSAELDTLRGLHAKLLLAGRSVQIRTFHSWFAALLRGAPLAVLHELRLPAHYELLESDSKAVAQVWRRFHDSVAKDEAAKLDYQEAVAQYGRHNTELALQSAIGKRTEFTLADAHGVAERSVAHFTQQFPELAHWTHPRDRIASSAVQTLLWNSAKALGSSTYKACVDAAIALERALSKGDVSGVMDALLTEKGRGSPRKLNDKVVGIETVREAQALLVETRLAIEQHEAWLHQQRMTRLCRRLLKEYADLKRERGWIDMGDLELAAQRLLTDERVSGWIQERLDAHIKHLLIDEFQDTSPLQWQALGAWLQGYGGAGPKPSVFIVGDPKQSIYRFRRAEPQVFRAAKDFMRQALQGDVLSCDHTHRNAREVIAAVNAALLEAQTAKEFEGFRPHTTESGEVGRVWRLPPIPRPSTGGSHEDQFETVWRDSLTEPRIETEDTLRTLECRHAARWLAAQLQARGGTLQPQDVMVLARKREPLGNMQRALAELGIAAQQPEKTELGDMEEVRDMTALLDVLVSPAHDLSLARVLKSPIFGASDDDLVALCLRCRSSQHRASAGEDAPSEKSEASPAWLNVLWEALAAPQPVASDDAALSTLLIGAAARLKRWQVWVHQLPVHDALSRIYDDGDVLARYAAAAPSARCQSVLANLRALLHAALQLDGGRYTTPYTMVRALRTGGISAPVQAEVQGVRLFTIHAAKGLEADLVLLLDTDSEPPRAESMGVLVDWPGEAAYPQKLVFLASESRPPQCAVNTLAHDKAARAREELNALYVALTRARHTLVISSIVPFRDQAGSWWKRLYGLAVDAPPVSDWESDAPKTLSTAPAAVKLWTLPTLSLDKKLGLSQSESVQNASKLGADDEPESVESRLGQAMHRLLEWAPLRGKLHGPPGTGIWTEPQLAQIARAFELEPDQMWQAESMALGILGGDGAWAWQDDVLAWHANEVGITFAGRTFRLDRLVQRRDTHAWWVLDFKSSANPQSQPALREQLHGYRTALAQICRGKPVHAAFLTPQGRLIELQRPDIEPTSP
jgi:ATP-dependent helicase/nuclease subunit A